MGSHPVVCYAWSMYVRILTRRTDGRIRLVSVYAAETCQRGKLGPHTRTTRRFKVHRVEFRVDFLLDEIRFVLKVNDVPRT